MSGVISTIVVLLFALALAGAIAWRFLSSEQKDKAAWFVARALPQRVKVWTVIDATARASYDNPKVEVPGMPVTLLMRSLGRYPQGVAA